MIIYYILCAVYNIIYVPSSIYKNKFHEPRAICCTILHAPCETSDERRRTDRWRGGDAVDDPDPPAMPRLETAKMRDT